MGLKKVRKREGPARYYGALHPNAREREGKSRVSKKIALKGHTP